MNEHIYVGLIYQLEVQCIEPTAGIVSRAIGVSAPTARKQLNSMIDEGYLFSETFKRGNTFKKVYRLAEGGLELRRISQQLFDRWQTIRYLELRNQS